MSEAEPVGAANFDALMKLIDSHERGSEMRSAFRSLYLEDLLSVYTRPKEAMHRLLVSLDAHEELKDMERIMCKKYFKSLIESDFIRIEGTNKNEHPICWLRVGYYSKGHWRFGNKSPELYAWVRALTFGIQAAYEVAGRSNKVARPIFYCDESERGGLDFNAYVDSTLFSFLGRLFPSGCLRGSIGFGVGFGASMTIKVLKRLTKHAEGLETISESSLESVYPYVSDKSTIPSYYLPAYSDDDNDGGAPEDGDRDTEWMLSPKAMEWKRRLLNNGPSLHPAEIFNPSTAEAALGVGECSDDAEEELATAPAPSDLVPILEDDEDDDW